jgi:hypothetical protein
MICLPAFSQVSFELKPGIVNELPASLDCGIHQNVNRIKAHISYLLIKEPIHKGIVITANTTIRGNAINQLPFNIIAIIA